METKLKENETLEVVNLRNGPAARLTMFILVPNLHQSVTLSRCCEQRSVGTERHVMNRRCCVTLPDTFPRLVLSLFLLVSWCFWIATSNLKFY